MAFKVTTAAPQGFVAVPKAAPSTTNELIPALKALRENGQTFYVEIDERKQARSVALLAHRGAQGLRDKNFGVVATTMVNKAGDKFSVQIRRATAEEITQAKERAEAAKKAKEEKKKQAA